MNERILSRLEPVRRRQLGREVLRFAAVGLLAGSMVAIGLGVLRWQDPGSARAHASGPRWPSCWPGRRSGHSPPSARGRSARSAAAAVDAHYDLKDRAVSAVAFLGRGKTTPIHELQVADADQHMRGLDPQRVVPFRVPTPLPFGAAAAILALGLLLWPRPAAVQAKTGRAARARRCRRRAGRGEPGRPRRGRRTSITTPSSRNWSRSSTNAVEQMKQPGVDVKEALAKLSEMQAAIAAQQATFNVGLVDTQMQALGEALASTEALDGAGQSLQVGKYDKAADQLEQADPKFDRKEVKNLKEKLAKAAKQMEEAGLADLSTATKELAEALESDGSSSSALKKLSNLARAQGRRKRINDLLTLSNNNLSECKSNCSKAAAEDPQEEQEGHAQQRLGTGHQRQYGRPAYLARLGAEARPGQGPDGRGRLRDRDDPHARRPPDSPRGSTASNTRSIAGCPRPRSTPSRSPWATARPSGATSS